MIQIFLKLLHIISLRCDANDFNFTQIVVNEKKQTNNIFKIVRYASKRQVFIIDDMRTPIMDLKNIVEKDLTIYQYRREFKNCI